MSDDLQIIEDTERLLNEAQDEFFKLDSSPDRTATLRAIGYAIELVEMMREDQGR